MNLKKKDVINLTEKHYIAEDDPDFKIIDNLAYKCKNLKNAILYELRQQFFANGTFLSRKILEKRFRDTKNPDFIALMGAISQHVFMMVYSEYKSFFGLNKAYKKGKIKDKPNIPNYLHKTEGRYVVCFTNQQCRIRNGWLLFAVGIGLKPIKTNITGRLIAVRIVMKSGKYKIEIIYETKKENLGLNKDNHIAIDSGVNNLVTITSDNQMTPVIVNGRPLKSINQYFNKELAKAKSELPIRGTYTTKKDGVVHKKQQGTSKKITNMYWKRDNRIEDYLHKTSKLIIQMCLDSNSGTIIIGHNKEWKQECNMGDKNNQNFINIPHSRLIQMIKYKAALVGIEVIEIGEAYTSKCSALELEELCHHEQYLGKRPKRGKFVTSTGEMINADVNGSLNIMRKVIGDASFKRKLSDSSIRLNAIKIITPQ